MTGKLFLSGGGDEKQTFALDEIFIREVSNILYIPLAWPNEDFDSCLKWFTGAMSAHKQVKIEMITDLYKEIDLKNYDTVYLGGGNTFKLLKYIKESNFDKKLLKHYNSGGTIYGGSAGALIWGNDINLAKIGFDADVNAVNLKDTTGFDVLDGLDIQCHYRSTQLEEHQRYIAKTGRNIIAIPEESAVFLENRKAKVIGLKAITLIKENSSKDYQVNEEIRN